MNQLGLKLRYIALFILQIFDGLYTYLGVQKFGTIDVEGNPIVHYAMTHLGVAGGLLLIKAIACLFIAILYYETWKDRVHVKLFPRCLDFFIMLYSVVVWTWYEILFMRTQPLGDFIVSLIQTIKNGVN